MLQERWTLILLTSYSIRLCFKNAWVLSYARIRINYETQAFLCWGVSKGRWKRSYNWSYELISVAIQISKQSKSGLLLKRFWVWKTIFSANSLRWDFKFELQTKSYIMSFSLSEWSSFVNLKTIESSYS